MPSDAESIAFESPKCLPHPLTYFVSRDKPKPTASGFIAGRRPTVIRGPRNQPWFGVGANFAQYLSLTAIRGSALRPVASPNSWRNTVRTCLYLLTAASRLPE